MNRAVLVAAAVLTLGATSAAAPAPQTRAERLAQFIQECELKLRAEHSPPERQRLADEAERARHELGPYDPAGNRVRCKAMWHSAAVEALDTEAKRLASRIKTASSAPPSLLARLHARRMALKCLERGWAWDPEGTRKYQVDAFGQYLANNLATLDTVFDAVGAVIVKEEKAPADAPGREPLAAAIADARKGIGLLEQAADGFAKADTRAPEGRDLMLSTLGLFVEGLRTVCDAQRTFQDLGAKGDRPEAPSGAAPEPSATAGPLTVTPEDQARLAAIRRVAAALEGPEWAAVQAALRRYAAVAEQGLAVARARVRAIELLDYLALAARFVGDLAASKSAHPAYVMKCQEGLVEALESLGDVQTRRRGYSILSRMDEGAEARRKIDAGPLSPGASRGLFEALGTPASAFAGPDRANDYEAFSRYADVIVDVLGKMRGWRPQDLEPDLAPLYRELAGLFAETAEAAGRAKPAADSHAFAQLYVLAGSTGRDLERLVTADRAVKAVAKYVPTRRASMSTEVVKVLRDLTVKSGASRDEVRQQFDDMIQPYAPLVAFEAPEPDHLAEANRLTGGSYKQAVTALAAHVTAGIDASIRGKPRALEDALEPHWMFRVVRHRCIAEAGGLSAVPTANLAPFSVPEVTWKPFLAALDQNLRRMFQQYAADRLGRAPEAASLDAWDELYCAVAVGQRLTLEARRPAESALDLLLRNLDRTADASPPDGTALAWAVAYHTTEGAAALTAGFVETAAWHRTLLRRARGDAPSQVDDPFRRKELRRSPARPAPEPPPAPAAEKPAASVPAKSPLRSRAPARAAPAALVR